MPSFLTVLISHLQGPHWSCIPASVMAKNWAAAHLKQLVLQPLAHLSRCMRLQTGWQAISQMLPNRTTAASRRPPPYRCAPPFFRVCAHTHNSSSSGRNYIGSPTCPSTMCPHLSHASSSAGISLLHVLVVHCKPVLCLLPMRLDPAFRRSLTPHVAALQAGAAALSRKPEAAIAFRHGHDVQVRFRVLAVAWRAQTVRSPDQTARSPCVSAGLRAQKAGFGTPPTFATFSAPRQSATTSREATRLSLIAAQQRIPLGVAQCAHFTVLRSDHHLLADGHGADQKPGQAYAPRHTHESRHPARIRGLIRYRCAAQHRTASPSRCLANLFFKATT